MAKKKIKENEIVLISITRVSSEHFRVYLEPNLSSCDCDQKSLLRFCYVLACSLDKLSKHLDKDF